jgi:hypothetical protein
MDLLTDVSSRASHHSNGAFTREQFVSGMLRELSVCLCRRNAAIERVVASCFKAQICASEWGLLLPWA